MLVLAGHGSARSRVPADTLAAHAKRIRGTGAFSDVRWGMLAGGPSLENLLAEMPGRPIVVMPMFMSDGYLARVAVPAALGLTAADTDAPQSRCDLRPPIGLSPRLSDLMLARARRCLSDRAIPERDTTLLVVAHGSSNEPASARVAETQVARLSAGSSFATVRAAYLEQTPSIAEALRDLRGPVIATGLFAAAGPHASEDVPRALARDPDAHYLGPIGAAPAIADIVLDEIGSDEARVTR